MAFTENGSNLYPPENQVESKYYMQSRKYLVYLYYKIWKPIFTFHSFAAIS